MEKTGILRKTVHGEEPEKEGIGTEADEETAEASVHEELLMHLIVISVPGDSPADERSETISRLFYGGIIIGVSIKIGE